MKIKTLGIRNVPRFFVFLIDLVLIALSFILSYFILKQFRFPIILRGHFFVYTFCYIASAATVFYFMRIYAGVVRYTTITDMLRICTAILLTGVLYFLADELIIYRILHFNSLNTGKILMINFFVSFTVLMLMRVGVKGIYSSIGKLNANQREKVIIYGTGPEALVIKQAIEAGSDSKFMVVGFLSDRLDISQLYIQQKRVFNIKHLTLLKSKFNVNKLVMAYFNPSESLKKEVISRCLELGIKILTVPPSNQWVYGRLKMKQIQDLKIEDLLQRDPILISDVNIFSELADKRILITGAAGSIGSEIVRQIMKYKPAMVILCDQAESPLHEIYLEISDKNPDSKIVTHIASIRSARRMRIPFEKYHPQVVFHAAAYKHVPMMESHPMEAILTNVLGTKLIGDLSVFYNVSKFVMISTDKAVNPTNIMGASKRIAEMYVQALHLKVSVTGTKFVITRFGNVLDSNGSVIPRFRQQIQEGGPVTVTHPDIVRYFMTIPEAVQLVLEAGSMGRGGEIFVFDMGSPMKILELAKNMIKLAGLTVDKDIEIKFTGLRPGEKLYEELLNDKEMVKPTHHEKIKIANVGYCEPDKIKNDVNILIHLASRDDTSQLVRKMKDLVPEYISQNSVFEHLDLRSVKNQFRE